MMLMVKPEPLVKVTGWWTPGMCQGAEGVFYLLRITDEGLVVVFSGAEDNELFCQEAVHSDNWITTSSYTYIDPGREMAARRSSRRQTSAIRRGTSRRESRNKRGAKPRA